MKFLFSLCASLFFLSFLHGQQTVRIEITSLPASHVAGSPVYLAGSFNNWNPGDEKFRMTSAGNSYWIELSLPASSYEYKLTGGSWEKVETQKNGSTITNRKLNPGSTVIRLMVEGWQNHFPSKPKTSTATKNVCILDTAFTIPELDRKRRVWIYLPPDYCDGSNKKYPVLYMHDGQNVFDDSSSFSGEWGVDEFLDSTVLEKCIVIAIDHAGNKRMNEYNPFDNEKYGRGEGDLYIHFLVKTLKPFVDKRFRTLRKKENTIIAGSSMGGLISIYALLKYPKVFGGAGVFSPAFQVTGDKIFNDIKLKGNRVNSKIYFYGGKQEGPTMVPGILRALETIAAVSHSNISTLIRDDGEHNEATWRVEFPLFYKWMMTEMSVLKKPAK